MLARLFGLNLCCTTVSEPIFRKSIFKTWIQVVSQVFKSYHFITALDRTNQLLMEPMGHFMLDEFIVIECIPNLFAVPIWAFEFNHLFDQSSQYSTDVIAFRDRGVATCKLTNFWISKFLVALATIQSVTAR